MQAPMSRFEQDTYVNDRYAAMEERLTVGRIQHSRLAIGMSFSREVDLTLYSAAGCPQKVEQANDLG